MKKPMKKPILKSLSLLVILTLILTSLPVFARAETLHPTGCLPDSWETIASHLAPPRAAPAALPASVDLTSYFPSPGSQGNQGSCVAWAVAYGLKTMQEQVIRDWGVSSSSHQFSPAYVYNQINGGVDNGSTISAAMSLIVSQGVCTLATFPYNQNNWTLQPTSAQRAEAANYKAKRWDTVNGTVAIKERLAARDGVVVGIAVYPDFDAISPSNPIYDVKSGSSRGNHAIVLVGYDDSKQAFKFMNSWGANWGLSGYGWIAYNMLNNAAINVNGAGIAFAMTPLPYVKYNANGGAGAPASQTNPANVTTAAPSTPKSYTLTYNANGGSVSPASKSVACSFRNWNTNAAGTGTAYSPGAAWPSGTTATLYAQWNNPTAGTLPTPTHAGYSFQGWFTAASGGSQVTSATTITANTTIYAHWLQTYVALSLSAVTPVTITSGGRREARFTASSAGIYLIESTNRGSLDPTAYSASSGGKVLDDDSGMSTYNYRFQVKLTAGQTYTYYSGVYDNASVSGTYSVKVTSTPSIKLSLNTAATVQIISGCRREITYTASSAGKYVFESSNCGSLDPTAYKTLSGSAERNDDSGKNFNYKFQVTLSAGQTFTYYSGVWEDGGVNGSYKVTVKKA